VRIVTSIVTGLALAMAVVLPVLGHAELVSSTPDAGSTLDTPPETITLTFSEGLDASKSSFKVLGPDGEAGVGKAPEDGSTVMAATGLALGPGTYTVEWTAVAEDGHVERGTFEFTVSQPTAAPATPTTSPDPTPTEAPSTGASQLPAAPMATPSAAPPAAPSPGPGTDAATASGGDVLVPIVVALVLVAVVGFIVLRRNRAA